MTFTQETKMCTNKNRYISEEDANKAIDKMKIDYPDAALITWSNYKCPICLGFHVTHAIKQLKISAEEQKRKWLNGMSLT